MPKQTFQDRVWETVPEGSKGQGFGDRLSFLLENLGGSERVLDLGCGEGWFLEELVERGFDAVGCDLAAVPLQRARRRRPQLPVVQLPQDGEWPFAVSEFDVVWCSEVVEHVLDTGAFFSELRRVLRSGGLLLVTTPNHPPQAVLSWALSPRRFARAFDVRSDHIRFYNSYGLRRLLEEFGFERVEIRGAWRRRLYAKASRRRF